MFKKKVPGKIFTPKLEKSSLRGTWGPVPVAMYCEWYKIKHN